MIHVLPGLGNVLLGLMHIFLGFLRFVGSASCSLPYTWPHSGATAFPTLQQWQEAIWHTTCLEETDVSEPSNHLIANKYSPHVNNYRDPRNSIVFCELAACRIPVASGEIKISCHKEEGTAVSLPGDLLVLLWEVMMALVQRVRLWCWLNVGEQVLKFIPSHWWPYQALSISSGLLPYLLWPCLLEERTERIDPKVWTIYKHYFSGTASFLLPFSLKAAVCLLNWVWLQDAVCFLH